LAKPYRKSDLSRMLRLALGDSSVEPPLRKAHA
jgi:hypothetical protein